MYKGVVELGNINKQMKLRFNLVIKNDEQIKLAANNMDLGAISSYMVGGDSYVKLSPHPYLAIDINGSGDKNDVWNSNLVVNLTAPSLLKLDTCFHHMIMDFYEKELFFKKNGRLYVNQKLNEKHSHVIKTPNKTIKLMFAVVPDDENKEVEYEGIAFMINHEDNFCLLTYDELRYFLYVLDKIDFVSLSVQVINTYLIQMMYNAMFHKKPPTIQHTIREVKELEIPDERPNYAKLESSQMPEI